MSPAGTMLRVYEALKELLSTGAFRPGERIDPARMADRLFASTTPVRDALYRLLGEGLVDNTHHDGFRAPQISEAMMRDRYEWSQTLLALVVRAAFRHGVRPFATPSLDPDYRKAVADTFTALGLLSPNFEHRREVTTLVDLSSAFRRAELDLIPKAQDETAEIQRAAAAGDEAALRRAIDRFHQSRVRMVPRLAARLRDPLASR